MLMLMLLLTTTVYADDDEWIATTSASNVAMVEREALPNGWMAGFIFFASKFCNVGAGEHDGWIDGWLVGWLCSSGNTFLFICP